MRKLLFVSVLLAALLSAPLAAAAVVFQAAQLDPEVWSSPVSPAMWSARSFVMYFDLLVPVALVPCAMWMSRLRPKHSRGNRAR